MVNRSRYVSVGKEALRGNGSGSGGTGGRNVAIGYQAMLSANGNAYRNTAVGWQSMKDVTTGYQNVCLGKSAGYTITTGLYVNDARNTTDFSVKNSGIK